LVDSFPNASYFLGAAPSFSASSHNCYNWGNPSTSRGAGGNFSFRKNRDSRHEFASARAKPRGRGNLPSSGPGRQFSR
jgi:hypothetical protein